MFLTPEEGAAALLIGGCSIAGGVAAPVLLRTALGEEGWRKLEREYEAFRQRPEYREAQ